MAETIKYGLTELELKTEAKWRAVWDFHIPDGLPPVTAFAGAHIIFPLNEVPDHYRQSMLFAQYHGATRLVLIPYLSYGRNGLRVVVLQTHFGSYPNTARTVQFQMSGGTDFKLASVAASYIDEPFGRDIDGWWIANAFSYITYRVGSTPTFFPVLWVGALLVRNNMDAKDTNTFLYLCAIPFDENYTPIQMLLTLPSLLFSASYSWRYVPISPTHRGLLVRASSLADAYPAQRITVQGTQGAPNPYAIVEVYPSGGQSAATITFFNFPDDALSVFLRDEREFSGFNSYSALCILSPYEGKYWVYNDSANSFSETNISTQPFAVISSLSTYSFDGNTLIGANFQHIYFVGSQNTSRVFLAPQISVYPTVRLPNMQLLIKHGFTPFTELSSVEDWANANTLTKTVVPPLGIAAHNGRAVVFHLNSIFYLDLDSNTAIDIVKMKGFSEGITQGLVSPCDAFLPQNFIQSIPIFSAFYFARPARPISCIRVSRPYFLPGTTTVVFAGYIRAAEPGGSDVYGDWGKVILFERDMENRIEIRNVVATYDAQGALYLRFTAPISKEPIAFMVENPPFPYLRVGAPDSRYIIADSMKQPYLFEKELTNNINGTWVRMGQYIQRASQYEPPFYIRVFISPKHSQFVRVIAYKAGGVK